MPSCRIWISRFDDISAGALAILLISSSSFWVNWVDIHELDWFWFCTRVSKVASIFNLCYFLKFLSNRKSTSILIWTRCLSVRNSNNGLWISGNLVHPKLTINLFIFGQLTLIFQSMLCGKNFWIGLSWWKNNRGRGCTWYSHTPLPCTSKGRRD